MQGIGLYPDERTMMQILNHRMKGKNMVIALTKCTNKRKDKETAGRTQESRNTKKG
ncbi:hypothetical protein PVK06_004513 [Gossypium arboreum]|uniref:Uncharacterized protein n=1 Tax=Gossypium arboreum TaxID=29729 RepID=A0ABR0QTG9_GOSAR|nr:hypothetical protein PVK06_004513 [Gossypium arboreum]